MSTFGKLKEALTPKGGSSIIGLMLAGLIEGIAQLGIALFGVLIFLIAFAMVFGVFYAVQHLYR